MPTRAMKFAVTDEDIENAQGSGGEPAPDGFMTFHIVDVVFEEPADKNKRWVVTYRPEQNGETYQNVRDYLVLTETAKWKVTQFLVAIDAVKGAGDVDLNKVMPASKGKSVRGRIISESWTRPNRQTGETETVRTAKAGGVWPLKGGPSSGTRPVSGAAANGETSDIARFLAMDEDELAAKEDEIRALAEPLGIDPDAIDTWTEVVQAIAEGGGSDAAPSQDSTGEDQPRLQDSDRWREILGLDEDGIAEIAAELEQYNLTGLQEADFESWEAYREAINDALNESDGSTAQAPEDWSTWSVEELRGELKARGLNTKGGQATLVQRLQEADGQTGPFG